MRLFRWTPALLVLAAACQSAAGGGALSEQDKTSIRDQTAAFVAAINAKDWPAATAQYSADAVFMPANGVEVSGPANIQTWMAAYPPFANFVAQSVEVDGTGDLAYNRGTYELDVTPPGATTPMHDKGKFLEVLRRQADGTWKVVRDIFNSDLPIPAPAPAPKP